jgi:DNA-binding CsgD family transcriptional regulator
MRLRRRPRDASLPVPAHERRHFNALATLAAHLLPPLGYRACEHGVHRQFFVHPSIESVLLFAAPWFQRDKLAGMGSAKRRKQRVPPSSADAARSAGAKSSSTEVRASRFRLAGDDYVVLSYPKAELAAPAALTSTEQTIFSALLSGQSNGEIALSRDRSLRTVANQVAAIFGKLGVGSRAELFAKYSGR